LARNEPTFDQESALEIDDPIRDSAEAVMKAKVSHQLFDWITQTLDSIEMKNIEMVWVLSRIIGMQVCHECCIAIPQAINSLKADPIRSTRLPFHWIVQILR
jgi:hypothetical protein